ncbi:hypothetical protein QTO34_019858 [Cnephaeus nilssonii]|uniref:Uncharacterized protein n=1 Tax=Cnephaeus nilssonii TaxID=3371016 RepID=A0AA40LPG2_CNENI|nr:hypothetical protein QTO34_019858 [Eptesicus nilssonii]
MASIWGGVSCAQEAERSSSEPSGQSCSNLGICPGWCGIQHLRLPPAAIRFRGWVCPPDGASCPGSAPGPASSCMVNPSALLHHSLPAALAPIVTGALGRRPFGLSAL